MGQILKGHEELFDSGGVRRMNFYRGATDSTCHSERQAGRIARKCLWLLKQKLYSTERKAADSTGRE